MEDKGDHLMNGHDVALLLSGQNPFNLPHMMLTVDPADSALSLPSSSSNLGAGPVLNLLNGTGGSETHLNVSHPQLLNALNGMNTIPIHLTNGLNGLNSLNGLTPIQMTNGTNMSSTNESQRQQLQLVSSGAPLDKSQSRANDNTEITVVDGVVYNNRGYEVCGQLNQHSKPCQRIGKCPFHSSKSKHTIGEIEKKDKGRSMQKTGPYKQGWTKEEHMRFLNGLQLHGKGAWKEIALLVTTRTPTQIQSHAQKYYLRQKQEIKNKRSIHDTSLEDLTDTQNPDTATRPTQNVQKNSSVNLLQNINNTVINVSRPIPHLACPPGITLVNPQQNTPQFQHLQSDQFPIVFTNPIMNAAGGLAQFPYSFLSPAGFPAKLINFGDSFPISHLIAPPTLTLSHDSIDASMTRSLLETLNEESDLQTPNQVLLQLAQHLQKPDENQNQTLCLPTKQSSQNKQSKHSQTIHLQPQAQQPLNLLRSIGGDPKQRQNNSSIQLPQLVLQQPLQLNITTHQDTDDLGSTSLSLQFPMSSNEKLTKRKFDLLFDDHRSEKQPKLSTHQHDISSYI